MEECVLTSGLNEISPRQKGTEGIWKTQNLGGCFFCETLGVGETEDGEKYRLPVFLKSRRMSAWHQIETFSVGQTKGKEGGK